jgi:hypothetical protein
MIFMLPYTVGCIRLVTSIFAYLRRPIQVPRLAGLCDPKPTCFQQPVSQVRPAWAKESRQCIRLAPETQSSHALGRLDQQLLAIRSYSLSMGLQQKLTLAEDFPLVVDPLCCRVFREW